MNGVAVFSASGRSAQCGRIAGVGRARLCSVVLCRADRQRASFGKLLKPQPIVSAIWSSLSSCRNAGVPFTGIRI